MYGVTGKPMMVQNVDVFTEPISRINERKLKFVDCVLINDKIWFSALNINGLFCADYKTGKAKFIGHFPSEYPIGDKMGVWLYWPVQHYNNKLIFGPANANDIIVYDIKINEFIKHELRSVSREDVVYCKFNSSILFENYIYFIPSLYPSIVRFDIETSEITYITEWEFDNNCDQIFYYSGAYILGNICYLPSLRFKAIYKLDMAEGKGMFIDTGFGKYKYMGIYINENILWALAQKVDSTVLAEITIDSGNVNEYIIQNINNNSRLLFVEDNKIWIDPENGVGLLSVDMDTIIVKAYPIENNSMDLPYLSNEMWFCKKYKDEYWMQSRVSNKVYRISKNSKPMLVGESIYYAEDVNDMTYEDFIKYTSVCTVSLSSNVLGFHFIEGFYECSIEMLLNRMGHMDLIYLQQQNLLGEMITLGTAGTAIYNYISEAL
jgi:hypothetical protein